MSDILFYPFVSMMSVGAELQGNFGQVKFLFDIEGYVKVGVAEYGL